MREVLRTNDIVRISWLQALFSDRGIRSFVLDSHTSVLEGSVGAIPRRLMVGDDDYDATQRILREANALDGGGSTGTDVILGGRVAFLGHSSRSNREGVEQMQSILKKMGYEVNVNNLPPLGTKVRVSLRLKKKKPVSRKPAAK